LADKERLRLLAQSELSIENLQRLQTQLCNRKKTISLGQLRRAQRTKLIIL